MQKRVVPALLALFAVAYLAPLGIRPLYETDEFRYAEIPREMLASGDWVVPRLDGMRYFEKPAFGYWLTASSMAVFGQNPSASGCRWPFPPASPRWRSSCWSGQQNRPGSGHGGSRGRHPADESLFYLLGCYSTLDMPLTMFLTVAAVLFTLRSRRRIRGAKCCACCFSASPPGARS